MSRRLAACLSTALLGVAAASACACGSSGSAAPEVEPGAPAGDVREVSGTVTARRGADGTPRPLAVGDVVSGDDIVETATNASVVIELRHNGARWSLGAGQSKEVALSLAWKASRGEAAASVSGDRSTAAGRLAEREGADTAASAIAEERAAAPAAAPTETTAAAAPAAAAPAPPATESDPAAIEEPRPRPRPARREAEPPPSPKPPPPPSPTSDKEADDIVGMGDVETTGQGSGASGGGGGGSGSTKVAPPAPPQPTAKLTSVTAAGALSRDQVRKGVGRRVSSIAACWTKQVAAGATGSGTVALVLKVGTDGAVTGVDLEVDSAVEAARDCIASAARRWTFPAADQPSEISAVFELGID